MSVIQKTANYTVTQADSGYTFSLAGNAFFTFTLPSPSVVPTDFSCTIINADDWTGGGHAKYIAFTGDSNPHSRRLWPGQSIFVQIIDGSWQAEFHRARLPGQDIVAAVTFFVDPSIGSDNATTIDGLSSGAGAYKSIHSALVALSDEFDFDGRYYGTGTDNFNNNRTLVIIQLAADATDTQQIHWTPHSLVGALGSNAVVVNLNGGTLTGATAGADTVQLYRGAYLSFRNGTITSTATGGVTSLHVFSGASVFLLDGMTLGGATGGSDITVEGNGLLEIDDNYTIATGTRAQHMMVNAEGRLRNIGTNTATLGGNVTFSNAVVDNDAGVVDLTNLSFVLNAHTVTGISYVINDGGVILNSAALPGTTGSYGSLNAGGAASTAINIFDRSLPADKWSLYASAGTFFLNNASFGNVAQFNYTTGVGEFFAQQEMPSLMFPTLAPPGTPSSGFVLYVDNTDGNKLKCKASTGTVTVLATP